jgi:NADH dehydrogenase (ubiquinone) 1 beta subcomplex subunit 11
LQPACLISTSKKQDDAATAAGKLHHPVSKPLENLEEKEENWISYGYDLVDRDTDEWSHHLLMFTAITVMICFTSLFIGYYPDFKGHAWAQREAYLELARREKEGLPLIDPNLIDPAKINLPSDKELADFEIVI